MRLTMLEGLRYGAARASWSFTRRSSGSRYGGTSKGTPASPHWLICIVGPHAWTRPSHRRKGAIVAMELSCR